MKVIDLLNKIANGEEVPKTIKFQNYYCYYRPLKNQYTDFKNEPILEWDYIVMNSLNDEVEIIEEDKDIEEFTDTYILYDGTENEIKLVGILREQRDKINELIREVNKLKNKE